MSQKTLNNMLSSSVHKHENEIAIVYRNTKLSYIELEDRVSRFAQGLISLGLKPRDRVAIMLPNCPEFIISFFAVARIGAVIVPLNIHFRENEIEFYITDFQVRAIIADNRLVPLCKEILAKKNMQVVLITRGENEEGLVSMEETIKENPPIKEEPNIDAGQDVMYQFSSGSTGKSKRIARAHYNLVCEAEDFAATVDLNNTDIVLTLIPLFHTYGLCNCMLAPIHVGGKIVILEEFRPREVIDILEEEAITVFPGVPFMFGILADTFLDKKIDLFSLRLCISAGAPLPRQTFERFYSKHGIYVRQQYGSTETGAVSINFLDERVADAAESVGLPIKNVEIEIVGEDGNKLKNGDIGEVAVKSPAMARGYFNDEALTGESFRDGYFFTGDLGRKDEKGYLYIVGRKKSFINTATHKVDPSEVESLLSDHEKVAEVVVLGEKSHYGDEIVKAVIVPRTECNEEEIIDYCRGKIADFKIPRVIEFGKEIPKSPLGKVLRKYLVND
ncbi:MAG TPA: AMP-binding protein [Thermodesulfobacteriota bacterium]|nr:AMP-binding protein [Thermodesulfobacteriota bacterium]